MAYCRDLANLGTARLMVRLFASGNALGLTSCLVQAAALELNRLMMVGLKPSDVRRNT